VRSIEGVPFSYAITHLPLRIARLIRSERMSTQPLIDLLEGAGIAIGRAEQTISARAATLEIGRALHVEPGAALLESERVVYDESDRPVEAIVVLYRPDVYRYAVDLRRTGTAPDRVWAAGSIRSATAGAVRPRAGRSRRPPPPDRSEAH
jgi:GntR family transcriptional regulator